MITRLRYPKGYQFFNANGAPLALGNLYYYVAGTATPQDTYSDSAGEVVNTNPIVLDGSGRLAVDVYLGSAGANYKEVLTTGSATVSPWPDDAIPAAAQPDWNAVSGPNQILNKPSLAPVATSGSYADLSNKPSAFTGDSGTGGASGLVPAPDAGTAAAGKFLKADGAWSIPGGISDLANAQSGAYTVALSATANTSLGLPPSGTLATTAQLGALNSVTPGTGVATALGNAANTANGIAVLGSGAALPAAQLAGVAPVFESRTSITVAPSGGDYTSIQAAFNSLQSKFLNQHIDIQVAAGTYTIAAPLNFSNSQSGKVTVTGDTLAVTLSSVDSSSGAPGDYSIVLNMASVEGISSGQYISFPVLTGGVNPKYLCGLFPITAVDAGANQITITSKHLVGVPSGAVTGAGTVWRSIINCPSSTGWTVWDMYWAYIGGICFVGGGPATSTYGLDVQDNSRVLINNPGVAAYGFGIGIGAQYGGSSIVCVGSLVAGYCGTGMLAAFGGTIHTTAEKAAASACTGSGVKAALGGIIQFAAAVATGNAVGVECQAGGNLYAASTASVGNSTYGFKTTGPCFVNYSSVTGGGNGTADFDNAQINYRNQPYANTGDIVSYTNSYGNVVAKIGNSGALAIGETTWTDSNGFGNAFKLVAANGGCIAHDGNSSSSGGLYITGKTSQAYRIKFGVDSGTNDGFIGVEQVGVSWGKLKLYAGTVETNGHMVSTKVGGYAKTTIGTVSQLIAAATAGAGARSMVSDSTVEASGNFGAIVAGSGSYSVPVYSDGTNWLIG